MLDRRNFMKTCSGMGLAGTLFQGVLWAQAQAQGAKKITKELAFASVRQLAELVRTKSVSSLALTEMYLGRLKKYDPALKFVVTLTEERALAQAKKADTEIAAGKYRGPLHGLPWGAKDL